MARRGDLHTTMASIAPLERPNDAGLRTSGGNGAGPVRRLRPRLNPAEALERIGKLLEKAIWPDLIDCEEAYARHVGFLRFTCGYECLEVLHEALLERGTTGALEAPPRPGAMKPAAQLPSR